MDTKIKLAKKFIDQGKLLDAEKIYLDILDEEPNFPTALYGLSLLADKINDQVVREDLLQRAIDNVTELNDAQTKSTVAAWLAELSECLLKQNKVSEAKKYILESKKLIEENLNL